MSGSKGLGKSCTNENLRIEKSLRKNPRTGRQRYKPPNFWGGGSYMRSSTNIRRTGERKLPSGGEVWLVNNISSGGVSGNGM